VGLLPPSPVSSVLKVNVRPRVPVTLGRCERLDWPRRSTISMSGFISGSKTLNLPSVASRVSAVPVVVSTAAANTRCRVKRGASTAIGRLLLGSQGVVVGKRESGPGVRIAQACAILHVELVDDRLGARLGVGEVGSHPRDRVERQ